METLTEVLNMGGYGAYVWPSFSIAALAMLLLLVVSLRALGQAKRSLAMLQGDEPQAL